MIVVEERGMRRGGFAVECVKGGAVDEVNVEPAVMVVVEQRDTGAFGFEDVFLGCGSGRVVPDGEASLLRDVLEDDGAGLDEAAGGDRSMLRVKERLLRWTAGRAAHLLRDGGQNATEHGTEQQKRVRLPTRVGEILRGEWRLSGIVNSDPVHLQNYTGAGCGR